MIGTEFFYEDGKRKCRGSYTIEGDLMSLFDPPTEPKARNSADTRACRTYWRELCCASWSSDHAEASRNATNEAKRPGPRPKPRHGLTRR